MHRHTIFGDSIPYATLGGAKRVEKSLWWLNHYMLWFVFDRALIVGMDSFLGKLS